MKWSLIIFALSLLVALPAAGQSRRLKKGPGKGPAATANVMDYGAVADAVAASGTAPNCTRETLNHCTTAGTGTDNVTAFDAAEAALPNGGIIEVPCGSYRMSQFIINTNDIWLRGQGACTKIYVSGTNHALGVCKNSDCSTISQAVASAADVDSEIELTTSAAHGYVAGDGPFVIGDITDPADLPGGLSEFTNYWIESASSTTKITLSTTPGGTPIAWVDAGTSPWEIGNADRIRNVTISDLAIIDDDPEGHGHSQYAVVTNAGLADGTPAVGDDVSWATGSFDGTVVAYDATNGHIRIAPDDIEDDDFADDDDYTNGVWSTTDSQLVYAGGTNPGLTNEESHGIKVHSCENCSIERVIIDGIADEGIDIGGWFPVYGIGLRVIDVMGKDSPGQPGGGSVINIKGEQDCLIDGSHIEGGWGGFIPNRGTAGIRIEAFIGHETHRCVISNNRITVPGDSAFSINAAAGRVSDIDIVGNTFDGDFATGSVTEVVQVNTTTATNAINLIGNTIRGTIEFSEGLVAVQTNYTVADNIVTSTKAEYALRIQGTGFNITGNVFSGHIGWCLWIIDVADVIFSNNICRTNSDASTESVIQMFGADCNIDGMVMDGNIIEPTGTATHGMHFPASSSCPAVTASNNHIEIATTNTGSTRGIYNVANVIGNYVELGGSVFAGIQLDATEHPGKIIGNHVVLTTSGNDAIVLSTANNNIVSGNTIEGTGGATGYAIVETGTSDFNICTDNISIDDDSGSGTILCGDTGGPVLGLGCTDSVTDTVVGSLGACGGGNNGEIKEVTDANTGTDCTAGGGATVHNCKCVNPTWTFDTAATGQSSVCDNNIVH